MTISYKKPSRATVSLPDGSLYPINKLLGAGDSNAKLAKSDKAGKGYISYGLSLAPGNVSGYEVCPSRSSGCSAACLYTAGHGQMTSVQRARTAKTIMFFEQRKLFLEMLEEELANANEKAKKDGDRLAVRLNVLSDIPWEKIASRLFTEYPEIQYYSYTKVYKRMVAFCEGKLPKNSHYTFSRSECNEKEAIDVLKRKGNVAVVFDSKEYPTKWNGFKTVSGDEDDLRFLDPKGVVISLYVKGIDGKKDNSGFVVRTGKISLLTV